MADKPSQSKPVTTEDLYGTSAEAGNAAPSPSPEPPAEKSPLTYEETPIIEPLKEETASASAETPPPPPPPPLVPPSAPAPVVSPLPSTLPPREPKRGGWRRLLANLVFFGIVFGLGIWLSAQLRTIFLPSYEEETPFPTPTESLYPLATGFPTPTPTAALGIWKQYQVISGRTRQAIAGITYELPPEVSSPTCDGTSCPSQGAYLPGGTRFTVAARGRGQVLPDFRGAILTDAGGREFTMRQAVVGGRSVYEYTGNFAGTTGGGYTFTQMRGVLVAVSDTLSVEFNHFAPAGIASDFASDEVVFDKIIASLEISGD